MLNDFDDPDVFEEEEPETEVQHHHVGRRPDPEHEEHHKEIRRLRSIEEGVRRFKTIIDADHAPEAGLEDDAMEAMKVLFAELSESKDKDQS